MADLQTSIAITARTDGLQSGLAAAANAVGDAAGSMTAQFDALGAAAQQAQARITAAAAQIGTTINALQATTSGLTAPLANLGRGDGARAAQLPGISVREASDQSAQGTTSQLAAWRAELQGRLSDEQSFFASSKAEELAFWQDKLALTAAGSKEQFAVESNIYELEKQLAAERERDALAALSAEERSAEAAYARRKATLGEQAALGQISSTQQIAELEDSLDARWAIEQDYYRQKLDAAQDDADTQQKLTGEQNVAYENYLTDKTKLDAQAAGDSQRQWQSLTQPVERALDTSLTGLLTGTSTVQQGVARLARAAVGGLVGSGVSSVFGGLGNLLIGGLSSGSGSGGDQDFSGGLAGAGETNLGAGVYGGLFGSGGLLGALGVPSLFSGGLLGGLFKGIGSILGFAKGGIVPSAAGGWMVPNTSLALLHTNEMVLPADISQGLQSMIGSGTTSPPNVTFSVSAMDSQSVAAFFRNNGASLVAALNQAMRNGSSLRSS